MSHNLKKMPDLDRGVSRLDDSLELTYICISSIDTATEA